MITRIIHNEAEYLNLVADVIEFGVHCPNQFSERRDEDGLAGADSFSRFPADELYDQLGVYLDDEPLPETLLQSKEEDGTSWEEYSCHFHEWESSYRNKLKIFPDNPTVITPEPKHYPIIINWHWADDFDRMGDIKERIFQWWSLKKLEDIPKNSIKKTKELWETKFRAFWDEHAKEQDRKRNAGT